MGKDNLSGKKKYTNGEESKFFIPGTEPEGWIQGCTEAYKLLKAEGTRKNWENPEYREKQKITRSSQTYHDKISEISKEAWKKCDHDERCKKLQLSAQKRWANESERLKASLRMVNKWLEESYRLTQSKLLKDSKKDIYENHPEYIIKISKGNTKAWKNRKDEILTKQKETKDRNHSWNSSRLEENYYNYLINLYGEDDIIRQYRDPRYPFNCDFYIRSLDMFIEIQGTWCHGDHEFDPNNEADLEQLSKMMEKAESSHYYKTAIKVWTETDPKKKKIAEENNLNISYIY